MASAKKRGVDGEYPDALETERPECLECKSPDPQVRAAHHLALAQEGGLDRLKPHLYHHYAQTPRITTDERRDAVEGVCSWVANLMTLWSGFVDATTGAPLPWWEARRQMAARKQAIADAAYQQAPEAFQQRQHSVPAVGGLTRVRPVVPTIGDREPGEDAAD